MQPGLRTRHDAIIVGAGPAGSTAALLLARAGWAVALVEKQRFPRRKVCGECIAASNLPLLEFLGLGSAFESAGAELRHVKLMRGDRAVTAELPAADHPRHRWGRALGRETLDTLLLERAQQAGAQVLQPATVQAILGTVGAWRCEVRAVGSSRLVHLHAPLVIDAHGSWEDLPCIRPQRRLSRGAGDLFAFKANASGAALDAGVIGVLSLDGAYGGMVTADGGISTLACCIRRDRLSALRSAAPGLGAGEAVEAWLQRECSGVREAWSGASRCGPWLASGPLDPGIRVGPQDSLFRIGNAAGEAHPILGEGLSMALQSAVLLCGHLLNHPDAMQGPQQLPLAALQHRYADDWRRRFAPRLRLAAGFAHTAMRPRCAEVLMALARAWPGLLTEGARWGGKVRQPPLTMAAAPAVAVQSRTAPPVANGLP